MSTLASDITRPVLRYHGGKFRLAPWVVQFFPSHRIYVEPFGGAAGVLIRKTRVLSEVYNDLDSAVVNVFRVLRDSDKAFELYRRLALTPFAREEFDASYEPPIDDIDAAAKIIIRSFFGHGSDSATRGCRTGFRAKSHSRGLPSVEWSKWPEAIPTFTRRLQGVVIENRDALEVIARYDTPDTLIYVDPPYLYGTRTERAGQSSRHGYRHELTDAAHINLAAALNNVEGMVVLSGYPSDLYDRDLYPGWQRHDRRYWADGGKPSTEVVWLNQACAEALHQDGGLFA